MGGVNRASHHAAMIELRKAELLRLLVIGFTLRESAAEMKISYWCARMCARRPDFLVDLRAQSENIALRLVEEISTGQVEMAKKLEEASGAALEEMMNMMESLEGATKLKVQICQDLLDRDPKSSRTKRMDIRGTMDHSFVTPALLLHAASTAREIGHARDVDNAGASGPVEGSGDGQG